MRTWTHSLRPVPLFLAIWSCGFVGVSAGELVAHLAFGDRFHIVSILGISLSVAAGGTIGALRRRRRTTPAR